MRWKLLGREGGPRGGGGGGGGGGGEGIISKSNKRFGKVAG